MKSSIHIKYYVKRKNVYREIKMGNNTELILYRKLKPDVSIDKIKSFYIKQNGILTKSQLNSYTESLGYYLV